METLKNLTKKQKINAITFGLVAFVVLPLFTAVILSLANPITHSITELSFRMGYRAVCTVWGAFVAVYTTYTVLMVLRSAGYRLGVRIFFYLLLALAVGTLIMTGSISDNADVVGEKLAHTHNVVAIVTFVSHFVLLGLMVIASFFRNRVQGTINAVYAFFFFLTVAFLHFYVTDSETFSLLHSATAINEGASFCLVSIFFYLHYVENLLLAPTGKTKFLAGK